MLVYVVLYGQMCTWYSTVRCTSYSLDKEVILRPGPQYGQVQKKQWTQVSDAREGYVRGRG